MNKSIRLSDNDINAIIRVFRQYFGEKDHLWIFGSRTDMQKRGGDIDIYIETHLTNLDDIVTKKIKLLVNLKDAIGDQKIDVIIRSLSSQNYLPIYEEAKKSGVQLI